MQIETVLCPIDFSTLSDFELKLAVEVCEAFSARLVLHHNLAAAAPGLHKAWEWEKVHHGMPGEVTESEARQHMKDILVRIPSSVQAEARISRGPVGLVLLYLIKEISADLVLLGSHGWSTEEHASLSERIIESAPCPVLTIQESRSDTRPFRLHVPEGEVASRVLVPTDFSDSAATAVAYAFELARRSPLQVHLLHVRSLREMAIVPVDHTGVAVSEQNPPGRDVWGGRLAATRQRLGDLVPADLSKRVECHAEVGTPGDRIMAKANEIDAELIVMGEHARGFFRRYFTHDTSRELLHRAKCPVWFVPAKYGVDPVPGSGNLRRDSA